MKILSTDLQAAVQDAVRKVNDACYALRLQGISVEMPEKLQITVEVVTAFNDIERTQESVDPEKVSTTVTGTRTRSTESTPAGQTTTSTEGGGNNEEETRQYDEF